MKQNRKIKWMKRSRKKKNIHLMEKERKQDLENKKRQK